MNYYDDWLEHHGVKGMKWGVRKARTKASRARAKKQVDSYFDRGSLSDAQLRKKVERVRLENELYSVTQQAAFNNRSAARKWLSKNKQIQNEVVTTGINTTKAVGNYVIKKGARKLATGGI